MHLEPFSILCLLVYTHLGSASKSAPLQLHARRHGILLLDKRTLEKSGGSEGGGLRKTTSQMSLLTPGGDPAPEPEHDNDDTSSRAQSVWSKLRGGARSESASKPGSSSKVSRASKTVVGGSSPRSSMSERPWDAFGTVVEHHDEDSPPSPIHEGKQKDANTHEKLAKGGPGSRLSFKNPFGLGKERHDAISEPNNPPPFHIDEAKMMAQLHPQREQHAHEAVMAKNMGWDEKKEAVRRQHPENSSKQLLYLLTAGFGDPRLAQGLKPGQCHIVKITRIPGIVVPHSNERRTDVLVAGRLVDPVNGKPRHWEATAFWASIVPHSVGYAHRAEPFRPDEFPLSLFKPRYVGTGVHANVDYHKVSVDSKCFIIYAKTNM